METHGIIYDDLDKLRKLKKDIKEFEKLISITSGNHKINLEKKIQRLYLTEKKLKDKLTNTNSIYIKNLAITKKKKRKHTRTESKNFNPNDYVKITKEDTYNAFSRIAEENERWENKKEEKQVEINDIVLNFKTKEEIRKEQNDRWERDKKEIEESGVKRFIDDPVDFEKWKKDKLEKEKDIENKLSRNY
jgi:hypothetical protein